MLQYVCKERRKTVRCLRCGKAFSRSRLALEATLEEILAAGPAAALAVGIPVVGPVVVSNALACIAGYNPYVLPTVARICRPVWKADARHCRKNIQVLEEAKPQR